MSARRGGEVLFLGEEVESESVWKKKKKKNMD
jgi:hypothetical protein